MMFKDRDIPLKPSLPTDIDERRAQHTAIRRRMIQGNWKEDLEKSMLQHFSSARYAAIGVPDMSSNILEQITRQLSTLYNNGVTITHREEGHDITDLVGADGYVTRAGWAILMQRAQQMTLALRDCFVKVDVSPHVEGGSASHKGLQYRIVTPDYVYCESAEDAPDVPKYYMEQRLRLHPNTGEAVWIADVMDIRDPNDPIFGMYTIESNGALGDDVSEIFMGHPTHRGQDYPYIGKDGIPFLPLELYRAEKTGQLWNAYSGSAMLYGSLNAATLASWWLHLYRSSSWPQKYILGASLAGLGTSDQDTIARRQTIETDPASILVFQSDPDQTGQPMIGAFQPGSDPQKMMESLAMYEYRICTAAGLSSSVLKQSGDPRSGYSLSISREGQREAQRMYGVIFQSYDESLMAKSAKLANRFLGTNLPEHGYRVRYTHLPKSSTEQAEDRKNILELLGAGLLSPVEAIQRLHPDLDEEGAKQHLNKIRRERAEFM